MMNDVVAAELLERLTSAGRWRLMPSRTVLKLTGPDSGRFLDGQVTNSVARAKTGSVVPACLCNVKGKVLALVWISWRDDAWWVDGEFSQRELIFQRLDRYLIADDCELVDESEHWRLIHHWDDGRGGPPARRLAREGRDIWLPAGGDHLEPEAWAADRSIGDDEWRLLSTLSLLPEPGDEINGEEFPSELGLDIWAVDFHKGCYLGQEIVSRLQSVGSARRTLRGVYGRSLPSKGAPVGLPSGVEAHVTRNALLMNGLEISLIRVKSSAKALGPRIWWAQE